MPGCTSKQPCLVKNPNCMTYMWEEDNMGLKKRNSDVPGIVGLAQELDQLRGQFWLWLTQTDTF